MKQFAKKWKFTLILVAATPLALFIAVLSSGFGHGNYRSAKMLFPYTMLSACFLEYIATPFIVVAVVQFLGYGVLLDWSCRRDRLKRTALLLIAAHVGAAIACVLAPMPYFS